MTLSPRDKRLLKVILVCVLALTATELAVRRFFGAAMANIEGEEAPVLEELQKNRTGAFALEDVLAAYERLADDMTKKLELLKKRLEFPFPDWTKPPADANPGEYFRRMHARKRDDLRAVCMNADVALLDGDLGFPPMGAIQKKKAEENLRKLSLVEKLVNLLAAARVAVIVKVKPLDPVLTGAFKEVPNPEYRPGSRLPRTIRHAYAPFIKEYPVSLELITDIDPLMEFLNNIRREKQFLLVRDISISSEPKIADRDLAERFKPGMLHVVIAAAGMSFLSGKELEALRTKAQKEEERTRWRYQPLPKDIEPLGY